MDLKLAVPLHVWSCWRGCRSTVFHNPSSEQILS